jgi:hypothetical protein
MFNCKYVSKKVSKSMDEALPLPERMMISVHLWMCKYCRRLRNQLLLLRTALRLVDRSGDDVDKSPSLPIEIRDRIKQAMRNTFSEPIQ